MIFQTRYIRAASAAFLFCVSACGGGGGGGGGGSVAPPTNIAPQTGLVTFTLGVGSSASINRKPKRPNYIPPSTLTIKVDIAGTSQSLNCNFTTPTPPSCAFSAQVPAGQQTLQISAYGIVAEGVPLSHASIPVTVTPSQTTTVTGVLNGVITSVNLYIPNPPQISGVSNTAQIAATAYDWDGNVIVAPGNYDAPITLTTSPVDPSAPSGGIQVSPLVLNKPGDTASISYDGKSYTNLIVTANFPQNEGGTAVGQYAASTIVTPALVSTEYALPSGDATNGSIVAGSDGNMWFDSYQHVSKVTSAGTVTEYCSVPGPMQLELGPDGNVWYTPNATYNPAPGSSECVGSAQSTGFAEMTPNGIVSQIAIAPYTFDIYGSIQISTGAAGNFWATTGTPNLTTVLNLDSAHNVRSSFPLIIGSTNYVGSVSAIGSDGSVWITAEGNMIRCSTLGACSLVSAPAIAFAGVILGPGPSNDMLVGAGLDIYDLDLSGNLKWHVTLPEFVTLLGGQIAASNGSAWIPLQPDAYGFARLVRVTSSGTLSIVEALQPQATGAPIGAVAFSSDGRLWYTHGSDVGVATIP